jgi:hypothetical protein
MKNYRDDLTTYIAMGCVILAYIFLSYLLAKGIVSL